MMNDAYLDNDRLADKDTITCCVTICLRSNLIKSERGGGFTYRMQ